MHKSQAARVLKLEKTISQLNDVINELVRENYELQLRLCHQPDNSPMKIVSTSAR